MRFQAVFLVFFLMTLFLTPAFAADDTETLKMICRSLLNMKNDTPNITIAPVVENITPNITIQNFTFSSQYFAAKTKLESANQSVQRLREAGYPSLRAQDSFLVAYQWLIGQAALEEQDGDADYRFITEKADEIRQIERDAFVTGDDLKALEARMAKIGADADLTEAKALQVEAKKEFEDNRFEEAQKLVNLAYDKTAKAEADATRSRTLLESTRKNLENFLMENGQTMLIALVTIVVIGFIFQKPIRKSLIDTKIKSLSAERTVLEAMVKNLQKQYYDERKINDMSFHIKTKKFADMIRDINRQTPLLKEEIKKI